jgi:hypothetical protein
LGDLVVILLGNLTVAHNAPIPSFIGFFAFLLGDLAKILLGDLTEHSAHA